LLEKSGWQAPDDDALPTGKDLYLQYFKPFAELKEINPHIVLNSKVISIGRKNVDKMKSWGREEIPYWVQVQLDHEVRQFEASAVIDASGTWHSPNPIGSGGNYAIGELENQDRIFYGIPDILHQHTERYKNKSVLVVGSGHSSVNAILELDKLKLRYPSTEIHWVLRKKKMSDVYGGQESDALKARGELGIKIEQLVTEERVSVYTPFQIQQLLNKDGKLTVIGYQNDEKFALPWIDEIISNTGSRPDFSFLREVRLNIDPSLESVAAIAELIDPNIHSCGTVRAHGELELQHPDKNFYIVGSKSYGRAPTFLMATGYEQVRSIAAAIAGDMEAARQVELDLPETGVCSVDAGDSACCGTAPIQEKVTTKASCC
jgi:thioredoxin reductase